MYARAQNRFGPVWISDIFLAVAAGAAAAAGAEAAGSGGAPSSFAAGAVAAAAGGAVSAIFSKRVSPSYTVVVSAVPVFSTRRNFFLSAATSAVATSLEFVIPFSVVIVQVPVKVALFGLSGPQAAKKFAAAKIPRNPARSFDMRRLCKLFAGREGPRTVGPKTHVKIFYARYIRGMKIRIAAMIVLGAAALSGQVHADDERNCSDAVAYAAAENHTSDLESLRNARVIEKAAGDIQDALKAESEVNRSAILEILKSPSANELSARFSKLSAAQLIGISKRLADASKAQNSLATYSASVQKVLQARRILDAMPGHRRTVAIVQRTACRDLLF